MIIIITSVPDNTYMFYLSASTSSYIKQHTKNQLYVFYLWHYNCTYNYIPLERRTLFDFNKTSFASYKNKVYYVLI